MNINKKICFSLCGCLLFISSFLSAEIVTRAALDIGSGETKVTVADVDTETNQIVRTLYQTFKNVRLREDLATSLDFTLSSEIEEKLIGALKEMKAETAEFAPKQWFGVGTSVFRTAKNGQELLDRVKRETGITITLIPQAEEGEIGFLTAAAVSKMSPEEINSWDSGSGSFQISTLQDGHIEVYGAEFAFIPALEALFALRNKPFSTTFSPSPVSAQEAARLATIISGKLPKAPQWVKDKHLVGIGGVTSIFSVASIATGQPTYTRDQVWGAILGLSGKTDEQLNHFPQPEKVMVGLILLYSVMEHCGIESLSYFQTNGGCEGMLIMPRYWANL